MPKFFCECIEFFRATEHNITTLDEQIEMKTRVPRLGKNIQFLKEKGIVIIFV